MIDEEKYILNNNSRFLGKFFNVVSVDNYYTGCRKQRQLLKYVKLLICKSH